MTNKELVQLLFTGGLVKKSAGLVGRVDMTKREFSPPFLIGANKGLVRKGGYNSYSDYIFQNFSHSKSIVLASA